MEVIPARFFGEFPSSGPAGGWPSGDSPELLDERFYVRRAGGSSTTRRVMRHGRVHTLRHRPRSRWRSVPLTPRPRRTCTRPARFIILFCGLVQSLRLVSSRMFAHSQTEGRCRFSGLSFQTTNVPPAEAPPVLAGSPSACVSASPAVSGRGSRGSVGSNDHPAKPTLGYRQIRWGRWA